MRRFSLMPFAYCDRWPIRAVNATDDYVNKVSRIILRFLLTYTGSKLSRGSMRRRVRAHV